MTEDSAVPDNILARIRAMLALAGDTGATEAEAATAAQKAQELLTQYNLDTTDLGSDKPNPSQVGEWTYEKPHYKWQQSLYGAVAKAYFCTVYIDNKNMLAFVGTETNVKTAEELARWISLQLDWMAFHAVQDEELHKQSFRNNFLWGATGRIATRLKDKTRQMSKDQPQVMSLVIHHEANNIAFLNNKGLILSRRGSQARIGMNGYDEGTAAGDRVSIFGESEQVDKSNVHQLR